jgi:5-methylcytosine-specific restriction endonuclease McrA
MADFHRDSSKADGVGSRCKQCSAIVNKAHRLSAPEKAREYQKQWRRENADKALEHGKKWRAKNPERYLELLRDWRSKNSGLIAEYSRNWRASNQHKKAADDALRYSLETIATPVWINRKAICEFYAESARRTKATGIAHHVDHIVPLRSNVVCGLHNEFNLQVLTASENLSKSNRYWPDMP